MRDDWMGIQNPNDNDAMLLVCIKTLHYCAIRVVLVAMHDA